MGRVLITISVAAILTASVSSVSAMSLRDAVRHTLKTNPSLAVTKSNRIASGYALRQSQGRIAPTIDLSGDLLLQRVDKPKGLAVTENDRRRYRRHYDAYDEI